MISSSQIRQWFEAAPDTDLAARQGGARLRTRFVAFLALHHPAVLQRYLATEAGGPYAAEQLMLAALSEITRSRLRGTVGEEEPWALLADWIARDEDAYELINGLRPE